jgi:hypothetical protein
VDLEISKCFVECFSSLLIAMGLPHSCLYESRVVEVSCIPDHAHGMHSDSVAFENGFLKISKTKVDL